MRRTVTVTPRGLAAVLQGALAGLCAVFAWAAPAAAESAVAPAPAPPPGSSAPAPAAGSARLALGDVGGNPRFALLGRRIVVRANVTPYVPGQELELSFYLDRRPLGARVVRVLPGAHGAGLASVAFTSHYGGLLRVRAVHYATPQQDAFEARSAAVRYVNPNLAAGARGQSVRLLQDELAALRYAVPRSGVFEEGTGQALIAFRKLTGLQRIAAAGTRVFELLARGAGAFDVRYPGDGRHVEADLTKQVLAEVEPGGRVRRIYTMSSGKPSTPTVIGRFRVYEKTPGENSEGMVDSNYFIRGYAIHGYAEVPTYAASHGCLRVPIPDAPAIYAWVRIGTPVDVYE
ncbi:MAG TPA: L,D-transpeptidase family protein [Solirubrobacteraceae bacterium]|nr:L,D-transpeptidase family protein [Solirubrobacteraceae bacterium]